MPARRHASPTLRPDAQVYEGEQEAISDPALLMRIRAAFGASARANEMDVGTTADTRLINVQLILEYVARPEPVTILTCVRHVRSGATSVETAVRSPESA